MAALTVQMEAYAFRQLVEHLQWRTDVANIDLMNLAGFCRNCLSKWYHAGSKVYGLPMEYDEACERIYGEPYGEWKKKHNKPATDEQMKAFKSGGALHAKTEPKGVAPAGLVGMPNQGHSSVCGQDCEAVPVTPVAVSDGSSCTARIGIVTCSDRASAGTYADLSGPAAVDSLKSFSGQNPGFSVDIVSQRVVPDEENQIVSVLEELSKGKHCDLILTTGGTGVGPRDVTPEATKRVIARLADSLSQAMVWQTQFHQPWSILSRGICGVTSSGTLVVNLPGNPAAVRQCLAVLLPVLPQAICMLAPAAHAA